jgi:hypothetical protein
MSQTPIPNPRDFGYGEVEVIPPEPIVELPVPPWTILGGEWYCATIDSIWLFESEAKKMARKFIAELSELGLV